MSHWIRCSESKPDGGRMCLIIWNGHVQHVSYSRDGIGFACADGYEWNAPEIIDVDPIPDEEVSHWQYLPEAAK